MGARSVPLTTAGVGPLVGSIMDWACRLRLACVPSFSVRDAHAVSLYGRELSEATDREVTACALVLHSIES